MRFVSGMKDTVCFSIKYDNAGLRGLSPACITLYEFSPEV